LSGVGSKMSTGLWSTVGLVGSLAGRAKNAADSTVAQAQTEGWWDTALGAARQSVNSAVETTTWAAERSVEAVGAAVSHVKESDGKAILGKTSEVLDSTARKSLTAVESSVEWVTEQLGNLGVQDSRAGLSKMSSGTMQGFGSDFPPPSMASPTADPSPLPVSMRGSSYHDGGPGGSGTGSAASCGEVARPHLVAVSLAALPKPPTTSSAGGMEAPSKKVADLWKDDDWGEWH